MTKRSIVRTTLLLLPLQIVFRGVEALLPLLLAAWFGRNDATDVYYFSWAVFAFAGSLVFTAFQDSAVVPILAEVKLADPKSLPLVRGSLVAHTLVIGGALAAAIGLATVVWFRVRYDGDAFVLAARMVAPFALYLLALATGKGT
jgi:putative peptidoglycan lipid II flippase